MLVKPHEVKDFGDVDWLLSLKDLKAAYPICHELGAGCYLFIKEDDVIINYCMVEFSTDYGDDRGELLSHIFSGTGTSEPLSEMRHTYWGDLNEKGDVDGYTFYLPNRHVVKALVILQKYFEG